MAGKSGNKKIGVFDSGFGGLDILKGITKENPYYEYIYLGDTARSPYGTRTQETIYTFTTQAIDFFFENDCALVILACNTASAEALKKIQEEYLPQKYPGKKVLGVLIPAIEEAIEKSKNKRIGIVATKSTVESGAFTREINKRDKSIKVFEQACPLLVPIVEAGEQNHPATKLIIEGYLKNLKKKEIDTLILGCTHYGLLENKIKKELGKGIRIISEARIVPKKLKEYLQNHPEIEKTLSKKKKAEFYSTDLSESFCRLGSIFFGEKIKAKKITLE
ncbi:MAG: Glutamate racemase [Candidatus Nomurabacteria bacterium]|nr:Glutamate racemase [Candidatus Nomurabacteria bacterium]